jgi:hypothetical protein
MRMKDEEQTGMYCECVGRGSAFTSGSGWVVYNVYSEKRALQGKPVLLNVSRNMNGHTHRH